MNKVELEKFVAETLGNNPEGGAIFDGYDVANMYGEMNSHDELGHVFIVDECKGILGGQSTIMATVHNNHIGYAVVVEFDMQTEFSIKEEIVDYLIRLNDLCVKVAAIK